MASRLLSALALAAVALVFVTAALASREVATVGDLVLSENGALSPSKLPRHGSAPVTAHLEAAVGTRDGRHPPALRSADFVVSRSIGVDARGLPVCAAGERRGRSIEAAEAACGDALVGRGRVEVEVAFPGRKPFRSTGRCSSSTPASAVPPPASSSMPSSACRRRP